MKTLKTMLLLGALPALMLASCQKKDNPVAGTSTATGSNVLNPLSAIASNCNSPYTITLESVTPSGSNFEWVWSVQNPNPGNGSNGTVQNLSHWNITLGQCVVFEDIVSGAISSDGLSWTSFTPTYQQDNSMANTCGVNTGAVVKFDAGTSGTAKTYYKLVISKDVLVDMDAIAYYKSGANTGCGTQCFPGFGCPPVVEEEGCSYSQGYWFAKPNLVWPSDLMLGGYTYTQAEGKAIWNSSNAGGIGKAKKVFTQVAAIKLSGSSVLPSASVWPYVTIAENWLSTLPKLTAANVKSFNNTAGANDAVAAADAISAWIEAHHCD